MNQAEFEARQQEFDEKARVALAYVKAVREGTDEESVQRRKEEEARQKEREERLAAAETIEKVINCKTEPCDPNPDTDGNFCVGCPYYIANYKELDNAFKTAIRVLRAEEEQ